MIVIWEIPSELLSDLFSYHINEHTLDYEKWSNSKASLKNVNFKVYSCFFSVKN